MLKLDWRRDGIAGGESPHLEQNIGWNTRLPARAQRGMLAS
jgi:hypothetical protein